ARNSLEPALVPASSAESDAAAGCDDTSGASTYGALPPDGIRSGPRTSGGAGSGRCNTITESGRGARRGCGGAGAPLVACAWLREVAEGVFSGRSVAAGCGDSTPPDSGSA